MSEVPWPLSSLRLGLHHWFWGLSQSCTPATVMMLCGLEQVTYLKGSAAPFFTHTGGMKIQILKTVSPSELGTVMRSIIQRLLLRS